MKQRDDKLFKAVTVAVDRRIEDFSVQCITNTAWSFAAVKYQNAKLFKSLAKAAEWRMSEFAARSRANTA